MPSQQQIEALTERAMTLAEIPPPSEALENLNEMLAEFDLPQSQSEDPASLARRLFQSFEMKQHLENLEGQEVPLPRLNAVPSLTDLRSALLL